MRNKLHFPAKIYQIIETEDSNIIRWEPCGKAFRIANHARFEREVIPKYFRHARIASVQRQLNLYGFKCVNRGEDKGVFCHPNFVRGEYNTVREIRRISTKKDDDDEVDEAPSTAPSQATSPRSAKRTMSMGSFDEVSSPRTKKVKKEILGYNQSSSNMPYPVPVHSKTSRPTQRSSPAGGIAIQTSATTATFVPSSKRPNNAKTAAVNPPQSIVQNELEAFNLDDFIPKGHNFFDVVEGGSNPYNVFGGSCAPWGYNSTMPGGPYAPYGHYGYQDPNAPQPFYQQQQQHHHHQQQQQQQIGRAHV